MVDEKKTVLFLCTHNSCRSQMAEAFLRHHGGDRFNAVSGGLEPRPVHPLTIRVMKEVGLDISDQRPKDFKECLEHRTVHFAIFACAQAEANCPRIYPFALQKLLWPFDDPATFDGPEEAKLQRFRDVRDQIEARILGWLEEREKDEDEESSVTGDGDR